MAPSRTRLVLFVLSLGALYLLLRPFLPYSWFSYATRPLWDSSEAPSDLIVHYPFHENAAQACALHSWPTREEEVEIWDAVVVSTEVDLLLLRLHELSPHVSTFFILESSHTFTGQPKPPIVEAALATAAFDPFRDRIRFTYVQGRTLARGESPFTQENELRATMTDILVAALPPPPVPVPVMLFSDVDELPSRDAVALVAACDFGKAVHLGMKEYMYSFAWGMGSDEAGLGSWRGSAVQWKKGRGDASLGEYYRHSKVTEKVLVDAGWHCSWCFRTLDEFVVKAKGYSHTDRYRSPGLLRPAQIQKTICDGNDLAGMLPEGYTWREMAAKWHLLEERSAMHLPTYLTQHPDQFRFLLPRGCREREAAQRFTLDLDGDTANPKPQDDLPKLVGDVIERESGVAAPPTPVELVLRPFGATGFPSTQRLPTPSPALQPHSSTSHSHGSASSTLGEIPTLLASISAENDGVLASMSDAEIAAEQREVRESLSISEEILKMLETRGRKKAAERETAQVPPAARRRPDVAGVPPRPRVSAVEEEEEGSPEYIRKHFFPDEPRNANLDWMRPQVPREASAGDVAAWTFDLHGALIESSSSTPPQNTPSADHHVSSSSSFTLASLASLATSAVPSQRSTALLVLHRVLSTKSHASELGEKAWVSLRVETAVTAGRAIRDSNVGVASQAISLLAFLLATEPPQKAQLLQPQLEGAEGPPSVLASFLSTNPYPTLALHLSHASLEESSLASILSLLTSVLTLSTSSPSPDLAALLSTPNLLEALSKRFVALPWPPSPSSPTPLPSALAFFTLLSRSSRKAAQHLWNHKLVEPSLRFVAVLPWELDDESAPLVPLSRQLVCETLALWESMARYGLGTTLRTQGADLVDAVLRGSEGDAQIREALLRVLAVWTTAAVDPHITGHDIVWTQVQRWGEVAVEAHRSLVEDRGASRLLASAWWLLAEWLGGAKVNKSWRGEEERKWVGNKVGGDFSEGGRANVAVSDALRRLTQVGGDRDQVDGDADLVLSALRLSEAYEEPTTPPTPALLILDPPLVESAFAALVASRRPSSFVRRLLIYVLPTFTSLSTRLSHTLEVLVLLRPGDEVAARDLSTWVLSLAADVANHSLPALAALNPSLELVSLAKTAAIRPFITYAIVTSAGGRVVGPLYPTPRDLKLTAAQAPFAGDAPLLEADWPLVAFNELLRSATSPVFQQLPSGWDGSELELVRTSLALARVVQSSSATSAKPLAAQIVYDLIKVFMLEKDNLTSATPGAESDLFRDERVQYSMTALLAPLAVAGRPRQVVRPDARSSTCTLEGVSSLVSSAPFYQLYTDLIGLFDSISLSHPVFSQVVLPPLAMSYPVDYRKLLWIDYAHLLPTIHIDVGAAVTDHDVGPEGDGALASFLYPTESDASILAAYGDALVSGKVTRASTPFLYLVAVHHVAMTVFATSASSPGESIGRKLAGGISAKGSEELVGDVLAYKQGGAVGDMLGLPPLCYEGGERAERKARLELLGGPRVASA